jgi:YjbE family integral membrane protein
MAFWLPLLEIIWIDILLSGNNAVVIALACRSLPDGQRRVGVLLGSGAALALRILCTLLVVELLALPLLKVGGGVLLLWIAIQLVGEGTSEKEIKPASTLWSAIRIIIVADTLMSLDNMMAVAAAAKGSKLLILLGLALSIPFIVFGSTLLLPLFNRFPSFIWAGAALLGWFAGDLIGADPDIAAWLRSRLPDFEEWYAPASAFFVLVVACLRERYNDRAKHT